MIRPHPHLASIHRSMPPAESRIDALRLDKNEFLPCWPEEWFEEFRALLRPEHLSIHPETGPLYRQLSQHLGIPREQLLVTAGSDAAIHAAYQAFVGKGDEVVVPNPTFAMYDVYARVFDAKLVTVDYGGEMELPLEKLLMAITPRTKLVAVPNPNSPTGTVFRREQLEGVIEHAACCGAAVLIDEAYYPFHQESMIDLVRQTGNLIVTRTFSKAAGVAGMRIGFAASSAAIAPSLFAVKPMYEITTLSALLGVHILNNYQRVTAYAEEVRQGRELISGFFRSHGFAVPESHANFIHVDFGARRAEIARALARSGVLFKESFDHPSLARYSRFTVGPVPVMERFAALFEACTGLRGASDSHPASAGQR